MARQRVPVQLNQFIGGLNTEASPLSFPASATSDENNVSLLKDGSRRRRLGFDVEDTYTEINTFVAFDDTQALGRNQFRWRNPGGFAEKEFLVVQIGNYVAVHDLDNAFLSESALYSETFNTSTYSTSFNFAVVDGALVIATGLPEVTVFQYDGTSISSSEKELLIRDFFGVDSGEGVYNSGGTIVFSLSDPQFITIRPENLTSTHLYNLRNQTYALPRTDEDVATLRDMVAEFRATTGDVYPSNTDSTVPFIGPDASNSGNRTIDRYRSEDAVNTKIGTSYAPRGHFIINALSRGTSRRGAEQVLRSQNSALSLSVTSLPNDTTPGGARVIGQYAGRVWYGGFSGDTVDGDRLSPRMASYILFSQIVDDPGKINLCYQDADPTSHIDPDIVATDGGFVKLDEAYNIRAMRSLNNSLFIFAENGVWRVSGPDGSPFTATNYTVSKISSEGCVAGQSVVSYEQTIVFWAENAIYGILQNETGDFSVQNLTKDLIQSLYEDIPTEDKEKAVGYYDLEFDSFRWIYGNRLVKPVTTKELVFNTRFSVFTQNSVSSSDNAFGPLTVSGGQRFNGSSSVPVTVGTQVVTVGGETVEVPRTVLSRASRDSFYTIILSTDPTITYTFGGFFRETPYDWDNLGDSVDEPAYLTTGYISGGDARLRKDLPRLTTYFRRTEDPDFGGVDSGCLVSSRWDWTSTVGTSRWSTPRQAYRPSRISDGHDLVVTKNRIRGGGNSIALHFQSEEGKTFRLYGWEHNLDSTTEE